MDQVAIGQYIAKKRKEKNLTQLQLAERLDVSNKTVSKWENGNCMPDYSIIESLCENLEISLSELLAGEDAGQPDEKTQDERILDLLKRTQELENRMKKISEVSTIKTVQVFAFVLLLVMVFISIDLGINYITALNVRENDGICCVSILHALFGIFGDHSWTLKRFLEAFEKGIWGTFVVLLVNIVLAVWKRKIR